MDSEAINVRMQRPLIDAIDEWSDSQPDAPARPEAIRRLVRKALKPD